MAATAHAPSSHRTQAERRATTVNRLLDAAVECLGELGYAGTTTIEVARRAGVSRGAQLHHFGTKAELMGRALEHLHERILAEFRRLMASLPDGVDHLEASIDVMWELYASPLTAAWMEMSLAARNDEELRTRMVDLERRFLRDAQAVFAELFPAEAADAEYASIAPLFSFAVLDGLALRRMVMRDDGEVALVLDALKAVARLMAPGSATTTPEEGR